MKVLLVHAYCLALDEAEKKVMKPYPPLGVLYLSAYLKRESHEVSVFDGTFQEPDAFAGHLKRFEPEVVGFYANMMTRHHVLRLRAMIGRPEIRVAVGGPDPPHYADAYLDHGFEAVIIGEGEHAFSQWLRHLDEPESWSSIEGLAFRSEGQTRRTPAPKPKTKLDSFPLPDREAIDLNAYLDCWERHHRMRPVSLITSRGCPFQCTWCSHNVYGYSLRKRAPDQVLAELEWLRQHYRFDHYWFADDVFTIQHKWNREFRDLLLRNKALIRPFECISRADKLNPEIVEILRETACFRLWVGAESGSQRLLDAMKRGVTREQVARAMTLLREAGIETGMFFMWGFLDEDYGDVCETVSLALDCEPDIALTTVAYPIKGTVFHDQLAERGLIGTEPSFARGSDRDIAILRQPDKALYAYADRLLHSTLQARRLGRGTWSQKAKALAHALRAGHCRRQLKKGFASNR